MSHPEFLPFPLEDRVGYFDHDRFRGYLAVHCCSGLQPPGLRFAMAVTGHHARLGSRLRARLCRGLHFRRLNYKSFQGTTSADPDGRSLACGPAGGRGKAERNLCSAKPFLHPETERQATEVGRYGSGVLLKRRSLAWSQVPCAEQWLTVGATN